ncbi:hypothetical protein M073_4522, partial [Bacteroides fragilis str. DS-71]
DRLGKAILEKEQNGTKAFKAENDKEYYRQQMDNARTTSNRLRTENQELKTETKELKKELGKMKDLFNSEQLEALRHHFPNISKAMEEGKDLLKQITRSRGFGMGMYPPPRPQRGSDQTAASLNGVLRRSDSEEILQGSENGCVLILKKVYGVALVGTGGPAPCRWALPDR